LFIAKAAPESPWTRTVLTESYRCSPAICAALTAMADDGSTLISADDGKNKTYSTAIEVRAYDPASEVEELKSAIDAVAGALNGQPPHDGNPAGVKSVAVIARAADHIRQLEAGYSGIEITPSARTVWGHAITRDYLKVIYLLQRSNTYAAAGAYESLLTRAGDHASIADMRAAVAHCWGIEGSNGVGYRIGLFADLHTIADALPLLPDLKISDCVPCCGVDLRGLTAGDLASIRKDCQTFLAPGKRGEDRLLSSIFSVREERTWHTHPTHADVRLVFSTAHGVKGETHDAVVFLTRKQVSACGCPNSARAWSKILQHSMVECETKRIAYVTLSRAAQRLLILAPTGYTDCWQALTPSADSAPTAEP